MRGIKAVILAGGKGTRLAEETSMRPKPMVEIGGRPILWHIMMAYSQYGIRDFIICVGYKGYMIKEYFANFALHNSDVLVDLSERKISFTSNQLPDWRVHVVDTGEESMTGGRLGRIRHLVADDPYFCMTYGDGLADVDMNRLIAYHVEQNALATMTVVRPSARFGSAVIDGGRVVDFREKPQTEQGLINGGYFVLSPETLDLIKDDFTVWEQEPLVHLSKTNELAAFHHEGFWQPMDTLREKHLLEDLWNADEAPWKVWGRA